MRRLSAAALVAAALLVVASADAAVPTGNLLVNPGAEAGAGASDSTQLFPPPGWAVEGNMTAVQYGAPQFLTLADSAKLGGGKNFFAGGPDAATSAATQFIGVATAAAEID